MDERRVFGNQGERHAATYLKNKGYQILEKQFRTRFGEIDLIALDGDEIVFVEVKTRRSLSMGYPEESVHEKKLRRLEIAAQAYMSAEALEEKPHRFDVVAIIESCGKREFEHIIGV